MGQIHLGSKERTVLRNGLLELSKDEIYTAISMECSGGCKDDESSVKIKNILGWKRFKKINLEVGNWKV